MSKDTNKKFTKQPENANIKKKKTEKSAASSNESNFKDIIFQRSN